jgi:hypothetical protein
LAAMNQQRRQHGVDGRVAIRHGLPRRAGKVRVVGVLLGNSQGQKNVLVHDRNPRMKNSVQVCADYVANRVFSRCRGVSKATLAASNDLAILQPRSDAEIEAISPCPDVVAKGQPSPYFDWRRDRGSGSMADSGRSNYASADVCAPAVPRDFLGTDGDPLCAHQKDNKINNSFEYDGVNEREGGGGIR